MTTNNKDFVVKNGLVVSNGATFGGPVSVGAPISSSDAATKLYVDDILSSSGVTVGGTEPLLPSDGDLWFDTNINRLKINYSSNWIALATFDDSQELKNHIHDSSTGFVLDTFQDSPEINEEPVQYWDGGAPATTVFDSTKDGGNVYQFTIDGGTV